MTTSAKRSPDSAVNGSSATKKAKFAPPSIVFGGPETSSADYNWSKLHADLENGHFAGAYGASNMPYLGLSEVRDNVDLREWHNRRSVDEVYVPSLEEYLKHEKTQANWDKCVTIDPMGMFAGTPTVAGTTAILNLREFDDFKRDGTIVDEDGGVHVTKMGVEYAWNIPKMSERIGMSQAKFRNAIFKYCKNPEVLDPTRNVFLPPVGGATVYILGDPRLLLDDKTEVAVRVHDECNGSDVFGTDICTCRPYLMFALKHAVECAQRGGVGVIVYFRKEGRSLGEVTKYRVYNARKNQKGGDSAENYFVQTKNIAGVVDARFQQMMPDILVWLGIRRIDWLLSMSNEKFDAITSVGIQVMQRISLPDSYVPKHADIEINAKVASGYHTDEVDAEVVQDSLTKLQTIREKCRDIYALAKQDKLLHFELKADKLDLVVKRTVDCIKKHYPTLDIPYHSRTRHFEVQGKETIPTLAATWPVDAVEKCRRLVDLVTVSVLLDAGAGSQWKFIDASGDQFSRSEGLAVASLDMFKQGMFSSDSCVPCRVNSSGLKQLSVAELSHGFQVSNTNPMVGLAGRVGVLQRLGEALEQTPEYFGQEVCRPGHLVDYCLKNANEAKEVSIQVLWKAIIEGYASIWPTTLSGTRRGDVWVYNPLKKVGEPGSDMVPFHKLSQWLILSLLEPLQQLGLKFTDMELLTPLPEYRNGGLLVDTGVLVPRNPNTFNMAYDVGSELVIEWRAMTVMLIDEVAVKVRKALNQTEEQMPLAKVLQGGTWQAGRIIAKEMRADGSPPIKIRSDGTVF